MKMFQPAKMSLATLGMVVLTMAFAFALYVKINKNIIIRNVGYGLEPPDGGFLFHIALVVPLAIASTAIALGAVKSHSLILIMFQASATYLGCLSFFWVFEGHRDWLVCFWFQIVFAVSVAFPLLARRYVKTKMPKGPRQIVWKKVLEALPFAFLNLLLVFLALPFQYYFSMAENVSRETNQAATYRTSPRYQESFSLPQSTPEDGGLLELPEPSLVHPDLPKAEIVPIKPNEENDTRTLVPIR